MLGSIVNVNSILLFIGAVLAATVVSHGVHELIYKPTRPWAHSQAVIATILVAVCVVWLGASAFAFVALPRHIAGPACVGISLVCFSILFGLTSDMNSYFEDIERWLNSDSNDNSS
jgi:hypothetical protein